MKTGKFLLTTGAAILCSISMVAQSSDTTTRATTVPVRIGILPGLSTQGAADAHTTSNFSLNIWGGRTGSVNGMEAAGLFNINTGNVQQVQVAGVFNMVGGNTKGLQSAGIFNKTAGKTTGVQIGGILNFAGKDMRGMQATGIYNHTGGRSNGLQVAGIGNFAQQGSKGAQFSGIANISNQYMTGMQAAGIVNFARQRAKGFQAAGIANVSLRQTTGVQIAGILNYARNLKGLQVGLINIADSSQGFSLGLINIVRKGYHKLYVSANEVMNGNIAIKTGNPKLYTILLAGINPGTDNKVFSFGFGFGHEISLSKIFSLSPEITSQYLYLGDWGAANWLSKCNMLLHVRLAKGLAISGGPSFAVYYSDQAIAEHGYKFAIPSNSYHTFRLWNSNVTGWIGWHAGLTFF